MQKKYFIPVILLLFLGFCQFVQAQDYKEAGTSGFVFLEIPATARTAALGEASIALTDVNSSGIFKNPASLGFTKQTHSFSASYAPWIADIKNYATSYSYKSALGVFGASVIYFDYGEMPRTEVGGGQRVYEILGTYKANAIALGLSYSRMLTDRFSFGVSLKYVQEKIDIFTASNVLFDGGIVYYTGLESFRIAASIQNFGIDTKFIDDEFQMPAVLRLGMAMELLGDYSSEYRVTGIVEALHPNDNDERVNLGLEFSWNNLVSLRGGYKFFYDEESYSFGVGVSPEFNVPLSVDFAYADYGRLGNITRFTVQLGVL